MAKSTLYGWRVQAALRALKKKEPTLAPDEKILSLLVANCGYCGTPPKSPLPGRLALKDPALGFTEANTQSICDLCYRAKRGLSEQEFLAWVNRIFDKSRDRVA